MAQTSDIETFTDEQIRAELQRRADLISVSSPQQIDDPADLSELAPGTWGQETDNQTEHGSITSEWEGITRLAVARIRELLGIPLDPTHPNYGASLRGINSAVASVLTLISKLNAEMLRPPKQDRLPELLEILKEERQKLWEKRLPELERNLIQISDQELDELLAKRREHLNEREGNAVRTGYDL
jgi:hypothetical protein